jgi:hypothetical protein
VSVYTIDITGLDMFNNMLDVIRRIYNVSDTTMQMYIMQELNRVIGNPHEVYRFLKQQDIDIQ